MMIALQQAGIEADNQVPIDVSFRGKLVGTYSVDMLVEQKDILEFKAAAGLNKEHHTQMIHYVTAMNKRVGLLINFGGPRARIERFVH